MRERYVLRKKTNGQFIGHSGHPVDGIRDAAVFHTKTETARAVSNRHDYERLPVAISVAIIGQAESV